MQNKLYMIGNAHLDPVWLWKWQEGYAENRATFRSVLDRLNEYDDVIFTSSSAQFFEWIEEVEPELFAEIKERIMEGRIVLCGGWWIQPDCNIPTGESFARHSLLGQNYFYEKFGRISRTGYCVDSFGHNAMLPQILRQSRMDAYVFMRPCEREKNIRENLFEWVSPDGSSVMAFRIPGSYCAYSGLDKQIQDCRDETEEKGQPLMCFYGVGNHGGGPTIENINLIRERRESDQEIDIVFSSPDEYFEEMKQNAGELQKIEGDLQHHASGCYSLNSLIKSLNRRAENELLAAEKYEMVAAGMLKIDGASLSLSQVWKSVLFNQFHDILAGTILKSACEDAAQMYGEARTKAARQANLAQQRIASRINIPYLKNSIPIVVFNPLAWDVKKPIELEFGAFKNNHLSDHIRVTDTEGREYVHQVIPSDTYCKDRKRIVFMADIPSMGYKQYWIENLGPKGTEQVLTAGTEENEYILENEFLYVQFDSVTGGIRSYRDKRSKTELLAGTGAVGVVSCDEGDTWAHDVLEFHNECGRFQLKSIQKIEDGTVRSTVRVKSVYGNSELIQDFILYREKDTLEVKVKLNWQEKRKCLKLQFPANIKEARAIYEIPYGYIEKETDGLEEAMQNHFIVDGLVQENQRAGIAVLNDAKYSGDIKGSCMSLTVTRSPAFAHHQPYQLEEAEDDMYVDQGWQEFSYTLAGYVGDWKGNAFARKALEMNQKPTALIESYHSGTLPAEKSFIKAEPENVVISCCKRAYHKDGWIIRFYETNGSEVKAAINVAGEKMKFDLRPNEVKTIKLEKDFTNPKEVDFLEWEKRKRGRVYERVNYGSGFFGTE